MKWKVVFFFIFFLCLSSPLPPQNETIMGGGSKKKQAFFSVVQHWKISEEFFFSYPKKTAISTGCLWVCGLGARTRPPPLVI